MKQVLVDMDGVLADVYSQFIRFEKENNGHTIDIESTYGKLEYEAFPGFWQHVKAPGFFLDAPVMDGSIDGLKYLNDKYSVLVVSAAMGFGIGLTDKICWMEKYFPFVSKKQIVLCGTKKHIKGDVMIDDHTTNLDEFGGERILFTQPHNVYIQDKDFKRVNHWKEIIQIL